MSLVAYDASSDEESDDHEEEGQKAIIISNTTEAKTITSSPAVKVVLNGDISDDDDDFISQIEDKDKNFMNSLSRLLPKPKNDEKISEIWENFEKPIFAALPTPKALDALICKEEDDEFLHKKPNEQIIEKPNKNIDIKKTTVKITIPSLKNFQDVEKEMANKTKDRSTVILSRAAASSGLLSILPKAKSEQNFAKVTNTCNKNETFNGLHTAKLSIPSFVPDSVKHRRPAKNTEDVEQSKQTAKKSRNHISKIAIQSNTKAGSDESDDEHTGSHDFFSFNKDHILPEVSASEINALVAKKAARIVESTKNFLNTEVPQKTTNVEGIHENDELESNRKRCHQEQQLDSEALQALVGGSTKRRRPQQSDIQVIDINSSQVMPNKDEWMRSALASSTTYQPTGVLVDEEPASGTRRKHQITYLAHKAKANEAELQAMWSANRQNRRATQSKYGF